MRSVTVLGLMLGLLGAVAAPVPARGQVPGPLLCAVITALECGAEGECQRRTVESMNIPQFMKVDPATKSVGAVDGSGRSAAVQSLERADGRMILHGGQGSRGWSATITEATGRMSVAVVDDSVGFVLFGACTPVEGMK